MNRSQQPFLHPTRAAISETQRAKLYALLDTVLKSNAFYRRKLAEAGADARSLSLNLLPFTTRAEIEADQWAHPPYGTNLTEPIERYTRFHQTSGTSGMPVRWLDTSQSWSWWKQCWTWIFRGADVSATDRVFFAFSFGPFIGFWSAFETAAEIGCLCLPAGGMSSVARIQFLLDNRATVLCCTPSYALRLAEIAVENHLDLRNSCVTKIIVAGEPGGSIPTTRKRMEEAWNARVFDHAGMTEIGAWGYECAERPGGLHIIETEFVAELIDPQTTQTVADGREGELVLTNLGRAGSPLIRYRTGDMVRLEHGRCACGSEFAWAQGGVLGRVDSMFIVRGNNVFPSAIEDFVRGFADVREFNIVIHDQTALTELELVVEPIGSVSENELARRIGEAFRNRFHFQCRVTTVASGSLPRFDMKARRVIRHPLTSDHTTR